MQSISVLVAALSVSVCALSGNFTYIPRDVLLQFSIEPERSIYSLIEGDKLNTFCSVYFRDDSRDKTVPSPVSLLRFVYDETEAKTRFQEADDTTEEVARFIAKHITADTRRKLFFVSFANDVYSVQAVPEGIAEISILRIKENNIDYLYKKEREHGNIFDRFLIAEECKREDKGKTSRINNIQVKRKEAVLLLSFLAEKEFQLDLKTVSDIQEEGNKRGLQIPYGVNLFVSEERSSSLKLFDLTETRIKRLAVSSFDITRMDLKNTHIEELFLFDETALVFFYDSIESSEFYVEKLSFGNRLNPKSEKFLKLIERVREGETAAPRKIKGIALNRNSFFGFLEETSRTTQKEIHVEELIVTQNGKNTGPETSTRIVVSKRISIGGNACVLLFIELGPELNHLNIDEIQKQCRSPEIDIPRITIELAENKIIVKENLHVLQFLKKNITATEVGFFAISGKKALKSTKITLVSGEMERIVFWEKGLSALLSITNERIDVRHMGVIDTVGFPDQEKEEIKKKEFVIKERLYMKNKGILFLEFLGNTAFIPVIKIEVDCWKEHWGGFEETTSIHIETNALVESIKPKIEGAGEIKQKIGEIVKQKKVVVENKIGYQKLVFEEDLKYEEQSETGESEEQPITEYKDQKFCFKEKLKRDLHCYDFSGYLYGNYED
ncbi:MAG: uncharacterized protein A8A55_1787 [Amphiamblys sp. WSBS2006]|nr:MAG: uncharacterized protein A8A55_1787 [Amphiamblys sp. WSBS2006]